MAALWPNDGSAGGRERVKALDVLVVEDERSQREMLCGFLRKDGFRVVEAEDGPTALDHMRKNSFDVMILDQKMPGMSGLQVLEEAKKIQPDVDALMVTAFGSVESAVEAMKKGAFDYVTKPIDLEELLLALARIAERRTLIRENEILKERLQEKGIGESRLICKSPKMAEVVNLAGRVASSKASVLLLGESGTGKELLARLIHSLSPRSSKPLVTVNCAALPESLLESELFGHEKGAFTGAIQRRVGFFEQADGGTLFLDEVGDLSPTVQVKLLRFLQEGEFQRVGGSAVLRSDVRLISATHRDLKARMQDGSFREDLFYRLNVVTILLPPLRERREDIRPLVEHFMSVYAAENGKPIEGISREAMDLLLRYDYPGNVRELENIIERAVVITRGTIIQTEDLPFGLQSREKPKGTKAPSHMGLKARLEALERELIEEAMAEARSNQSKAASLLGLSERMLRYKLKKYGLKASENPSRPPT
jgi:two-component system NtrC family response regulator